MNWINQNDNEILAFWLKYTNVPMLVSMPNGTVLWCNEAFENTFGYSIIELQKIGWHAITVQNEDLQIDKELAEDLELGKRTEYQLRKEYIKKNNGPIPVILHALRYPQSGEFDCTLVSVIPQNMVYDYTFKQLEIITLYLIKNQENQASLTNLISNQKSDLDKLIHLVARNPITGGMVIFIISGLLFGNRIYELLVLFKELF